MCHKYKTEHVLACHRERHIRRLLLTLRSTILRATEEQIFLDASDLFSSPGGFYPLVEAQIQKGFVVRLVSGARSEPGLLLSAVCQREEEVIYKIQHI